MFVQVSSKYYYIYYNNNFEVVLLLVIVGTLVAVLYFGFTEAAKEDQSTIDDGLDEDESLRQLQNRTKYW